jgi:hypothetical protein
MLNLTSNCLAKKQTKHDVKYCYWLVSLSIHCVLLFALFTSTTLNKEPKIPLQVMGDTYLILIEHENGKKTEQANVKRLQEHNNDPDTIRKNVPKTEIGSNDDLYQSEQKQSVDSGSLIAEKQTTIKPPDQKSTEQSAKIADITLPTRSNLFSNKQYVVPNSHPLRAKNDYQKVLTGTKNRVAKTGPRKFAEIMSASQQLQKLLPVAGKKNYAKANSESPAKFCSVKPLDGEVRSPDVNLLDNKNSMKLDAKIRISDLLGHGKYRVQSSSVRVSDLLNATHPFGSAGHSNRSVTVDVLLRQIKPGDQNDCR